MFRVVLSVLKLVVVLVFLIAWSDLIIHGQPIVYLLMILSMILFSTLQKRTVYRTIESIFTIGLTVLLVIMDYYGLNLETDLIGNISFNTVCWVVAIVVAISCLSSLILDINAQIKKTRKADLAEREESN